MSDIQTEAELEKAFERLRLFRQIRRDDYNRFYEKGKRLGVIARMFYLDEELKPEIRLQSAKVMLGWLEEKENERQKKGGAAVWDLKVENAI